MTDIRKTRHVLPAEVTRAFDAVGDDLETRNLYIAALRAGGWTLQSISAVTGVTRERIRQISDALPDDPEAALPLSLPVPSPPRKAEPSTPIYVEPDPEKLARLLELQPDAQRNRNNSNEAQRKVAEDYTKLVWEVHNEDGVTLYRLAKRLGITHGALRFRLARYGYKLPEKASVSKVYTRIDPSKRIPV